jgi:hypothetical protein
MKKLSDAKIKEKDDGTVVVEIDDPPVEGYGSNVPEALRDAAYETEQFAEGVLEALYQAIGYG